MDELPVIPSIVAELIKSDSVPKPVIPRAVAVHIKEAKLEGITLLQAMESFTYTNTLGVQRWIANHSEEFAQAWMIWPQVEIEEAAK